MSQNIKDFKIHRRERQQRRLKNWEFAFFQSLSQYYSYPLTLSNVGEPS